MAVDIRVPTLGESIVEATVGRWLKRVGDTVARGEPLVELETDKINMEVMAEQPGVLQRIEKQAGEDVAIGDVLGTIEVVGSGVAASSSAEPPTAPAQPPERADAASQPKAEPPSAPVQPPERAGAASQPKAEPPSAPAQPPEPSSTSQEDGHGAVVSPVARRMAAENNIDIHAIHGTGPGGRVTKEDIAAQLQGGRQAAVEGTLQGQSTSAVVAPPQPGVQPPAPKPQDAVASTRPPVPAADRREERVRMSRRRQTIARRLVEAQQTAAMLTTFNEIDMSAVLDVRKRRKDSFKERYGIGLGFMSFFTKAAIGALKAFPLLNAEIQGDELLIKYYYDIGIAVGAEEGLVVPVLRDADRKSFATIEREIAELAKRARENTLGLTELQGGTFTITNGGIFGSLMSTPILNTPQVGILGMHKIEERPIALNGQVVIRPMMYVALSYDHRIVDGSEAVRFLVRIKELVEDPEALLLEG